MYLLLYFVAILGNRYGRRQIEKDPENKLGILGVAEGALFALLGLLVAFSFTGAYGRFELRKELIVDEANAIRSANFMISALPSQDIPAIRETLCKLVQTRFLVYRDATLTNIQTILQKENEIRLLQNRIWLLSSESVKKINSAYIQLLLPALTTMFETTDKQLAMSRVHPPITIFFLLFALSMLSSFFTGYSTARKKFKGKRSIYIISYIAATTITLYVIFDLELPRLGLLRVTTTDRMLYQLNPSLIQVGNCNTLPYLRKHSF